MLNADANGNLYEILNFTTPDLSVLQDAVAARTPNLRLASIRLLPSFPEPAGIERDALPINP